MKKAPTRSQGLRCSRNQSCPVSPTDATTLPANYAARAQAWGRLLALRRSLKTLSRLKVEWGPNLESCALTRGTLRVCGGSNLSQALIDKLQIIERYNHGTKRCCVLS
jgi:hypothetical protein